MEIEFNPGRYDEPVANPGVRRAAAQPAGEPLPYERAQALEQKLRNIPQFRPEKVAHAKALASDVQYPPEETLDRIANLLALHVTA